MWGGALEAEAGCIETTLEVREMHPWISEQANRQHVAELRSLGRPFGSPLAGRRAGRLGFGRARQSRTWQGVTARKHRLSVGF